MLIQGIHKGSSRPLMNRIEHYPDALRVRFKYKRKRVTGHTILCHLVLFPTFSIEITTKDEEVQTIEPEVGKITQGVVGRDWQYEGIDIDAVSLGLEVTTRYAVVSPAAKKQILLEHFHTTRKQTRDSLYLAAKLYLTADARRPFEYQSRTRTN